MTIWVRCAATLALGISISISTAIRIMPMDCPAGEALIRHKLARLPAVAAMEFNLMQRVMTVTHAPHAIEFILDAVRTLGFKPEVVICGQAPQAHDAPSKPWWSLALALVAAIASEIVAWVGQPAWLAAVIAIFAAGACGLTTHQKGWWPFATATSVSMR